ncbi:MAG: hypothetical protein HC890_01925 [Chloroflexaceae bacterium]|nr:hypothetical protein [Chloroflexaceae bacterium]
MPMKLLSFSLIALSAVLPTAIAEGVTPVVNQEWYNCLTREVWSPHKQAWCAKLNQLKNREYSLPNYDKFTLKSGTFENTAQRFAVNLVDHEGFVAFGDLNGDGREDAVVLLIVNSDSSGIFSYLTPILTTENGLKSLYSQFLGDRVQVQSLTIAEEKPELKMVEPGPSDPQCCPTQAVTRVYQLQPQLVPVAGNSAPNSPLLVPLPTNP